jgi:hypothetical protein
MKCFFENSLGTLVFDYFLSTETFKDIFYQYDVFLSFYGTCCKDFDRCPFLHACWDSSLPPRKRPLTQTLGTVHCPVMAASSRWLACPFDIRSKSNIFASDFVSFEEFNNALDRSQYGGHQVAAKTTT